MFVKAQAIDISCPLAPMVYEVLSGMLIELFLWLVVMLYHKHICSLSLRETSGRFEWLQQNPAGSYRH